jgi:RHS repeat-associated protein
VNPDGSYTTESYTAPSFRRSGLARGGAAWEPLSGTVTGAGSVADPWTAAGLAWPVTLGRSASELVSVAAPGGAVSIGATGLTLGAGTRAGQTITYANVATATDLQLVTSGAGVKTNLVLKSASAPRSYSFHVSDPAGLLGGVSEQPDGSWLFGADWGDGYRLSLAPATAYVPAQVAADGLGWPGIDRSSASQSVVRAGDGWDVTVAVNPAWLSGKAFPVVLDPSPTFVAGTGGSFDCHLNSGSYADTSFCTGSTLREVGFANGFLRRTTVAFALGGNIPQTAQVTQADLDLYLETLSGGATSPVSAYPLTMPWNTTATWNSPGSGTWSGGSPDTSVLLATNDVGNTAGHYHWALSGTTVQKWVDGSGGNWGVLLKQPIETSVRLARFSSGSATDATRRPRLTVTYNDPAALQVDRTDSYRPVLSGLVTGSGTYDTTFTVTPPAGVGTAFTSPTVAVAAAKRAAYTIPDDKLIAGKTYTWTLKQCQGGSCSTSATQSFTVDPLIAAGDRGFFAYRDWQLTDRLKLRVNAASGNLLAEMSDLSVPGVGGDVTLGRTYNSLALAPGSQSTAGAAGPGWSTSVGADLRVALHRDGSATVYTPSGYAALFTPKDAGGFTGPPGINATLTRPDGNWRYTDHKSGAVWDFDPAGKLTTIKDRNKNTTWIRLDGSGNVSAIDGSRGGPDPTGGQSTRRVKVNDGLASTPALRTYTQLPNTGSPLATRLVSFGYTGTDLTTVVDAGSVTTAFGYDASHRLTSITTASGTSNARTTTIGYESGGYRVTQVRQEISAGVGPTTVFAYNDASSARTTTVTPPKVNAADNTQLNLVYRWDNQHRVTKLTNGFGKDISTQAYNGNSQVTTSTSSLGNTSTNTYAANNENVTQTTSAASATTDSTYGGAGSTTEFLPETSTGASNSASTYRYDGAGNMTSNTGGATNEAIIERNADGTVEFTTDPENINDTTTKASPACERTVGATPYEDNCTTYTYSTGNLTGISPPNGAGNLAARAYTYDGFGRLSTMDNGRGYLTTYTYDPMDRTKTTTTSKAGDTGVTYTYDPLGNQTARTDATGTVTYRYDKLNRLVVKDIGGAATDCTGGPTATRLCYGYDQASNLISLGDGRGTTTYHYSPIGLLDEVNEHTGRTIVMSYDDDQRRVNTWYATNIAANGTAYPSNVLTAPTAWAMRTLNDLDGDGRMTRTRTWRASSSTDPNRVADLSYSYKQPASLPGACSGSNLGRGAGTDAGRRTLRTDNETGLAQTYCYDGAGRLLVRIGSGSTTYLYTYDTDGNRKSDTVGSTVTNYAYNAANQLNNAGWTYDNAGNQLTGGDLTAAAYNGYDQASSMTPAGGSAISLAAAGTTNSELITQGTTTLRNGVPGVQALTTGGTTSYLQRDPKGGLLSIVLGSGTTGEYYYVLDGQSSVIGLVDAAGTERAEYTYDPYGAHDTATALGTGGLPNNPYRYASGRVVATNASGNALLYQYGERFYNPTTGRWTQQDNLESLGDPAQGNRYVYVGGDPVNGVDPTGRIGIAEWGGITIATVAGTLIGGAAGSMVYPGVGTAIGGAAGGACVFGGLFEEVKDRENGTFGHGCVEGLLAVPAAVAVIGGTAWYVAKSGVSS